MRQKISCVELGRKEAEQALVLVKKLALVEALARGYGICGDHLCLMRFSTGWKAVFGMPVLNGGVDYEYVARLPTAETLLEALDDLLDREGAGRLKGAVPLMEANRRTKPDTDADFDSLFAGSKPSPAPR